MRRYSLNDALQLSGEPRAEDWTAVIPAAGRGTRLGYHKPKILYPIAGRPILHWLIDLLEPHCTQLIFSLSPTGAEHVIPELEERLPGQYDTVVLESRGMADSIYQAAAKVTTPHTLIIWGDQVAIRPQTILALIKLHQNNRRSKLTLPIVERSSPYVHYATDGKGRFTHVLERREGAAMPDMGVSDCGLFACQTAHLQRLFENEVAKGITYSPATQEWNFLPLLPQLEFGGSSVQGLELESLEETIGVNDTNDVATLEMYFKQVAVSEKR